MIDSYFGWVRLLNPPEVFLENRIQKLQALIAEVRSKRTANNDTQLSSRTS